MRRRVRFPRWHKQWWLGICAKCGRKWIEHGSPQMWEERLGADHPKRKLAPPPDEGRMINLHDESKGLIATPEEALIARPDRQHELIVGGASADIGWTSMESPWLRQRGKDGDE